MLLVHDLAGTSGDWNLLADDLRVAGWCPVAVDWGRLARDRGWTSTGSGADAEGSEPGRPPEQGRVVARGAGGPAVQCAVQLAVQSPGRAVPPIDALLTLGPVWNGTTVLGVTDVEDLSRELGTFETVLGWERTWMDPLCERCREVVRGSDLLTRLRTRGVRTPGVAYTDIVSTVDLLVHPPLDRSPPGTDVRVVGPT